MWIVGQKIDEVAPADVDHGAGRDERAETALLPQAPVENRGEQGAALAKKRNVAGPRHGSGEGGIEALRRAHEPETVRSDNAHPTFARDVEQLALERRATRPGFAKPAEMTIA